MIHANALAAESARRPGFRKVFYSVMHMLRFIPLLLGSSLALAQQYTITTVAGGAPPSTPATAGSTSIGQPRRSTVDSAGNVYFSSSNSVFKLSGSGVLTLVAGNSRAGFSGDGGLATNAQLNAPQGVAVDSAGNIYIADSANNRVRVISGGVINTFAGNGTFSLGGGPGQNNDGGPATNGLLHLPSGVTVDKSGNVYIADTVNNAIRKVTTDGIINTLAGDSYPGFFGDGGNAQAAELDHPSDVALDSSGNVYVADTNNARIRKITPDGVITTFAGTGTIGSTGDGAAATDAALLAPVALSVDASGNVFIVENGDSRIRKIDTKGIISTIAGTGTAGFAGDGSAASKAQMNYPTGIAVDSSGNLYVADFLNLRVRKIDSSGNINSVAGNGVLSFSGDGGQALSAQMNFPQGVAADSAGNVYISDTNNNVVRRVSKTGAIVTIAGNGTAGSNGDGSAATSAQLNGPRGLALDSAGNLYIADSLNAKIRRVTSGGTISTYAGNGTPGFGGDGAAAASAQLNYPVSLAVDSAANLYIADFSNNRIRKVSTGGTITTVAGNGNSGYSGDGGPAANAQLFTPQGVAVDASNNVYIADTGNRVVRMVSAGGLISTIAGNGVADYTGDGGPAARAQLVSPNAIAVDSVGNVYIADGSTRIRQIVYPSGIITTIAGTGTQGYSGDGGLGVSAQINTPMAAATDPSGGLYIADAANNAVRALRFAGSSATVGSVVNAASNASGAIAPGEAVVLYGAGLGPSSLTQFQLINGSVPSSLAGTSVLFNGAPGPVLYTSANQVAAIAPFGLTGSNVNVSVVYQGQTSSAQLLGIVAAAPAIFTANSSGTGPAAAINIPGGVVNDAAHPAKAGDVVTLYLTGVGQTNPPSGDGRLGGDGTASRPFLLPVLPVTVTIGGKQADVQFAGGAPNVVNGIMQVNAIVPSGLAAGAAPVVVNVGSASSQNGVTVAVSGT
jgi:uncharacterized protein (TIGR03437 family)